MTPPHDGASRPPSDVRPAPGSDKATWRAWARERRRRWAQTPARADSERRMAGHLLAWAPWRTAGLALVYLPFGDEPDPLGPLLREHGAGGRPRLATTRTGPAGTGLSLHELDPSALERHPFGFDHPRPDAPSVAHEHVDVALVPGVLFDRTGTRIGYGRGLYDRLLARLDARAAVVGVAPRELIVEELPREAHDVGVGWLLSEEGVRRVEAGG